MPLPITPRRLAANRENAQKSTGPRTPAGKHRAAQNSLFHHAFCADLLHPGEDESDFHALRNALLADLAPQNALELCLADRVVSAAWRLRRLQHADRSLAVMEDADARAQAAHYNRGLEDAADYDDDFDPDNPPQPVDLPDPLPPGLLIARALRAPTSESAARHNTSSFERLLAAEHRLHGMMTRALRDLRQLRLDRRDPSRAPDDATPFAAPDTVEDDDHTPPPVESDQHEAPPSSSSPPPSPQPQSSNPTSSSSHCPSVSSVSSVAEPSTILQNEPTCHSDSSPATLLARAASLSAQALPRLRKERPNP